MDCAIPSLFPAAAPPPPGGEAAAGSGAELAALFASLVAELGGEASNLAAETPHRPEPDVDEPVDETQRPLEDELNLHAAAVPVPWLTEISASITVGMGGQQGGGEGSLAPSAPGAPQTGITAGTMPGEPSLPPLDLPEPAAKNVAVPAGETARTTAAAAEAQVGPEDHDSADAAILEDPESPAVARPPAAPVPPQAAYALARALAALNDGTADASSAVPRAASPASPPAAESAPIPTTPAATAVPARSAEPGVAVKAAAAQPAAVNAAGDAGGTSEGSGTGTESGSRGWTSPRHSDPGPVYGRMQSSVTNTDAPAVIVQGSAPSAPADRLSAPPPIQAAAPPGSADVGEQLVQAIRIRHSAGGGEARLRLNPEFLGEVKIELKVSGDRVSAVLHVERDDVRQQIEAGTAALKAALASQGLELDELTIRDDHPSRREGSPKERREPGGRKRRDAQGEVFEIPD